MSETIGLEAPDWAWSTLFETLELDATAAKNFDPDLKKEIQAALEAVVEVYRNPA
jgi:hypothetical protein